MLNCTFSFETPSDPEYKRFLENISCDEEKSMANPETLLGEIEAKTRELIGTTTHRHSFQYQYEIYMNTAKSYSQHVFAYSQADNASVGVHQE